MSAACFAPRSLWASLLVAGVAAIWHGAALGQPNTLYLHSAIYDPVRQRMVVFAGFDDVTSTITNGAWQFTLDRDPRWDPLAPAGILPSNRFGHSAIYDPPRDRMLVFGGNTSGVSADVWALSLADPPTWSSLQPSGTSPPARRYHTAIYDPLRDRMIVFGGYDGVTPFSDVWSLWLTPTPPRWELMTPSGTPPLGRNSHSAIYDPVRDRMLVFGGSGPLNDVWALSLGDTMWTLLDPSGTPPLARLGHSAVYDPSADRMIVFGGTDGSLTRDEVWQLSLTEPLPAWSPFITATDSPGPRQNHSAVYDSAYRRMVVFGGYPNVSDATWALSLGQEMRWSPARSVLELSPTELRLPTVTVGDTVSVPFVVSNLGLLPLHVTEFRLPIEKGMSLSDPAPLDTLAWREASAETLFLAAGQPQTADSMTILSNDPSGPRRVSLILDVRGLEFETRVLGDPAVVPLGDSILVIATPKPGVRVEQGTLYYRIADGTSEFDSLSLTRLTVDFIARIPASAVTEYGVQYYTKVENSPFVAMQPPGAPDTIFYQRVARPDSFRAVPRPTSGSEFLVGRSIPVEVELHLGTIFQSGMIHYRRGGEEQYESDAVSPSGSLGQPAATIPDGMVGPRGVEYWVEVRTPTSTLRFPNTGLAPDTIRTKVQNLAEQSAHPGVRYRMLSVPLDFGTDFSGSLDALLTDQFGTYDPVRWRAYSYDPDSGRNVEFAPAEAARFRPEPGRAFWLISRETHRVDTKPIDGLSTPTGREYPIVLAPGWNQFGNPFFFPVLWDSVAHSTSVQDLTAFDSQLGTVGGYATATPTVLQPFEGYFVFNAALVPETLWVPPMEAPSTQATRPALIAAAASADPRAWQLPLTARSEAAYDGATIVGVAPDADNFRDAHDRRKAPQAPGRWVSLYLDHTAWPVAPGLYASDLRSPSAEGHRWELSLRSEHAAEPLTLEGWAEARLPEGLGLRLIDLEQGTVLDLAPGTPPYKLLSFAPGRAYRVALLAGTAAFLEHETKALTEIPHALTLEQNAPNPFRIATRIHFGLPRAERVTLEIYSVLGQRVAAPLDRAPLAPGYHAVVWDGKISGGDQAPCGVYLLRLVAGGDVLTRRLILVR